MHFVYFNPYNLKDLPLKDQLVSSPYNAEYHTTPWPQRRYELSYYIVRSAYNAEYHTTPWGILVKLIDFLSSGNRASGLATLSESPSTLACAFVVGKRRRQPDFLRINNKDVGMDGHSEYSLQFLNFISNSLGYYKTLLLPCMQATIEEEWTIMYQHSIGNLCSMQYIRMTKKWCSVKIKIAKMCVSPRQPCIREARNNQKWLGYS